MGGEKLKPAEINDKKSPRRNILIAVSGLSPQIVTETLYDLLVQKKDPVHEIHVLTTAVGRDKLRRLLFDNGRGAFYRFCGEYGLIAEELTPAIHVIPDGNGGEMEDIRTPLDNGLAANFIIQFIAGQTRRENTRLIASIAGGRKTMSVYMGLALQLFGRDQDILTHVLVQPAVLESNPGFFYPPSTPGPFELKDRDGRTFTVDTAEVRIQHAEIPFVRLRNSLPARLRRDIDFSDLVKYTQRNLDTAAFEPDVTIDLGARKLTAGIRGKEYAVSLQPREMALYYFLASEGKLLNDNEQNRANSQKLVSIYELKYPRKKLKTDSFDKESIQQIRSRINRKIREQIPDLTLQHYLNINSDEEHYSPRYLIPISPDRLTLIPSFK